ncbi:MAG TPA: ATP/GTP-binding protein [Streptomyces sp.]|uniref:GTP-binding protein n=1 Tax=Streptomyces sp. TaxID=1931 RepID=UPI002D3C47C4|nr:ATP/GTP-binding protein [Streptomyces sp.]HZG04124.1 ATP/GTP-binding protein [Streptomyces sp.]
MVFGGSDRHREDTAVGPVTLKVLVAGGLGVGKTTLVGSVSEIRPLRTEEILSEAGRPFDGPEDLAALGDIRNLGKADAAGNAAKVTTVAMDFGRITLSDTLTLCLFGTPGQGRFRFLWDELAQGALGAVVLVDTRRLEDCFAAVDYFERHAVPFAVAVNRFDGIEHHPVEAVRAALGLGEEVPVLPCDVRERDSAREVLASVVEHALLTGAAGRQGAAT